MKEIGREQFVKGTMWKLLERFSSRGISLVISVVLARLLTPDDYGLIALTVVFTNLSEILSNAVYCLDIVPIAQQARYLALFRENLAQ